jgi:hypothetical protein
MVGHVLQSLVIPACVLLGAGGSLAAASPARDAGTLPAATPTGNLCSGSGWEERRGRDALRTLGDPSTSGFRIVFHRERDGFYGMTRARSRMIEVYVRSCERQSAELLRDVVAHELGHVHEAAQLDDPDRAAWLRARGISPRTPWYGCHECADFPTPAGDYAETYAQWLRGRRGESDRAGCGLITVVAFPPRRAVLRPLTSMLSPACCRRLTCVSERTVAYHQRLWPSSLRRDQLDHAGRRAWRSRVADLLGAEGRAGAEVPNGSRLPIDYLDIEDRLVTRSARQELADDHELGEFAHGALRLDVTALQ